MDDQPDRCRIVISVNPGTCDADTLAKTLGAGDVASVILYAGSFDETAFEAMSRDLVPVVRDADIAAIVCDDTRLAGRCDADGICLQNNRSQLGDVLARFSPQKIVGCSGIMDRHNALNIGEMNPDFLVLGKLGKDIKAEPHPKNLALGEWWAEFVEIPGIVPAGNEIESVLEVAQTKIDFVLLESALFAPGKAPVEMLAKANAMLDKSAPRLDEDVE